GANDDETAIDRTRGVICVVLVRPAFRRQGIGSELLRRAESYLVERGTRSVQAGPAPPRNPFYFGVYGGSNQPGFLDSNQLARPFFARHGYEPAAATIVLERRLNGNPLPADPRFAELRRYHDLKIFSVATPASWWQECVFGLIEPAEFRLEERTTGQPVARAAAWEMEAYSQRAGMPSAGILDVVVRAELRRRGIGRFLIAQLIRTIHEQDFRLIEVQCAEQDEAALGLLRGLGFVQVDT